MKLIFNFVFLYFCCTFNLYADNTEVEIIREIERMNFSSALTLIKSNKFDFNKKLKNGKYIADYILLSNYPPVIESFLLAGLAPNPTGDNYYLNQACLLGHTEGIKLLLNYGAPTEIWDDNYKTDKFGSPCIYFLLSSSNEEASKFYIEKAISQHGHNFLNNKLINYISMHKRATDNIYEYIKTLRKNH